VGEVDPAQLPALRALHRAVVELIDGLIAGQDVRRAVSAINRLAAGSHARPRLDLDPTGGVKLHLEWTDTTLGAALARRVVLEIDGIDRGRLRRCERPACNLVFYDTTRSNTRRWHAESPCGLRERQRRHRSAGERGN
jgi:predicted RNA-binding Zn ribbon-like protein